MEGCDGGSEVGGRGEGEGLLEEDGAHGCGSGDEVAVLRRSGFGVAGGQDLADVGVRGQYGL